MCGRFSLDPHNRDVKPLLRKLPENFPPIKTGEVFPGDLCLTMGRAAGGCLPCAMDWGLPKTDSKALIINARSETASRRSLFRTALKERRIAIPTTGFYEWRPLAGQKHKEKLLVQAESQALTWLAGIWDPYLEPNGQEKARFAILTRQAAAPVMAFHERMPVVLLQEEVMPWLEGGHCNIFFDSPPPALKLYPATNGPANTLL